MTVQMYEFITFPFLFHLSFLRISLDVFESIFQLEFALKYSHVKQQIQVIFCACMKKFRSVKLLA